VHPHARHGAGPTGKSKAVGWHPDSDGLGERYWDGASWRDFRIVRREWGCLWAALIWAYFPLGVAFTVGSSGLRIASALIAVALAAPVARGLRLALIVTARGVSERGFLRTRHYRFADIEDTFTGETPPTDARLGLRLVEGRSIWLGDSYPPRSVQACARHIRSRLPSRPAPGEPTVKPPSVEEITKRRRRRATRVARYLRKAGIRELRRGGAGTLLTEPILVFVGARIQARAEFDVFDQNANPVGSAVELDLEHLEHPYSWRYELRDLDGRTVVSCRVSECETPRTISSRLPVWLGARLAIGHPRQRAYAVSGGPDGANIATVGATTRSDSWPRSYTRPITAGGLPLGRLRWRRPTHGGPRLHVEDDEGHQVAYIASYNPAESGESAYVVELEEPTAGPLRDIALLASVLPRPPPRWPND
jgi:hypothetical protein